MTTDSKSPARTAWVLVARLVPGATRNYLDRQQLTAMKSSMVADIPSIANKAEWGLVLGMFKWGYAALSPFAGCIADRLSRRKVLVASLGGIYPGLVLGGYGGHFADAPRGNSRLDRLIDGMSTRDFTAVSVHLFWIAALALQFSKPRQTGPAPTSPA